MPAPVVADDRRLLLTEVADHRHHVGDQQRHAVVLGAFGAVTEVVAPLVDGDDLELVLQPGHLVTPGVPVIGEAVDHHDQRTLTRRGVVDLDAVVLDVSMADLQRGFLRDPGRDEQPRDEQRR